MDNNIINGDGAAAAVGGGEMGGDAQPQNRVQPLSCEELLAMVDAQNAAANDHTYDSSAYGSDDDVSVAFDETCDLDEQSFNEIKKNNKYYNELMIHDFDPRFDPLAKINWGAEGGTFSGNTRLRTLEICSSNNCDLDEREERLLQRNAKCMYRSIAGSRSIRCLTIKGCIANLEMGNTLSILSPFIQNNMNLCCLELGDFMLDLRTVELMESALLQCSSNLSKLGLNRCQGMNAEIMTKIVDIVNAHPHIIELSFEGYNWGDGEAEVLGDALYTKTNLKTLSLMGDTDNQLGYLTPRGVAFLTKCLTNPNSSMEELNFRETYIGPEGGIILGRALRNNTSLKVLNLHNTIFEGWQPFFDLLENSSCTLRDLDLGGNGISDEDIEPMVGALNRMGSLTTLCMWQNPVSSSGWVSFFDLMAQPGGAMETFKTLTAHSTFGSSFNDDVMNSIARALVNNTSLTSIGWQGFRGNVTDRGFNAIAATLCDKSSIAAIYESNHTFSGCCSNSNLGPLLKLNRGVNKAEVARQKIIKYHFLDGKECNLHELINAELAVLPRVFECIGKREMETHPDSNGTQTIKITAGFELLYRITKGMPSLFDPDSKAVGGKRKRET